MLDLGHTVCETKSQMKVFSLATSGDLDKWEDNQYTTSFASSHKHFLMTFLYVGLIVA